MQQLLRRTLQLQIILSTLIHSRQKVLNKRIAAEVCDATMLIHAPLLAT
jgi:hypothetical protein